MALKSVVWATNLVLNTERGPSESLWNWNGQPNAGPEDFLQDPRLGLHFFDDFAVAGQIASTAAAATSGNLGQWSYYAGKTALVNDASIVGAGLSLLPGSSASNEGITLQGAAGAFEITANSSGNSAMQGQIVFEARVMLQSVTSGMRDAFVGLGSGSSGLVGATFPITAGTSSNNLTSTNQLIGFYNGYSGSGDWSFVIQGGSSLTVLSNLSNLVSNITGSSIVAGSYYKLGFIYNPQARALAIPTNIANGQTAGNIARPMIKIFVNGSSSPTFLTQTQQILTASFPTGPLFPIVSICNDVSSVGASTNAGAMVPDWIRVAQTMIA
jgi:hypothetical protein